MAVAPVAGLAVAVFKGSSLLKPNPKALAQSSSD